MFEFLFVQLRFQRFVRIRAVVFTKWVKWVIPFCFLWDCGLFSVVLYVVVIAGHSYGARMEIRNLFITKMFCVIRLVLGSPNFFSLRATLTPPLRAKT
jgi:hypothetical protein